MAEDTAAEHTNRLVALRRLDSADKTGRVITALDATLEAGEPLTIAALALRFQGRLRPGQAQVSAQRAGAVLAAEQSPPLQHRNHIVHKILNAPCRVGGIRLKPSAPSCSNQRVISSAICSGVPTMVQCPPPAASRPSSWRTVGCSVAMIRRMVAYRPLGPVNSFSGGSAGIGASSSQSMQSCPMNWPSCRIESPADSSSSSSRCLALASASVEPT